MPRFIYESVRVASRVLQAKTKASGAARKPFEGGLLLKSFGQGLATTVISQIEGESRVMLTMSRGSVFSENFNQLLSGVELPSDDFLLPADTSKARYYDQANTIMARYGLHTHPCFCGGTREIKFAIMKIESCTDEFAILEENRPLTTEGAVLWNAQLLVNNTKFLKVGRRILNPNVACHLSADHSHFGLHHTFQL